MDVGMNLPVMVPVAPEQARETILDWSRRIDAGPFSTLAAGERVSFPNPEILVALSAAATLTERVRIAFGVCVLPMHPELLVAKQVATLDVLSAGRVSLGVGVGGREEDYSALGVQSEWNPGRWAKLERQVGRMRRAWAGERLVPGALLPIEPAPFQKGGPEILAGSLFEKSIRRAARWADGINGFSFGPDADEIGRCFDWARDAWSREGRPAPRLVTGFWFALGPKARPQLEAYLGRYLNFLGPGVAEQLAPTVIVDSPAALRDALARIRDLGADEVLLVPTTADPDELDRVADLLG